MHAVGCAGAAHRATSCNLVRFAEYQIQCLERRAWHRLSVASPFNEGLNGRAV